MAKVQGGFLVAKTLYDLGVREIFLWREAI